MELRHLASFCAIAEERNLTRAAERLRLRSPSLSQQLRRLEAELGTPLFVRSSAGMEPTAAGLALLPEARAALAAADRGARAARAAAAAAPPLLIGVPPGLPETLPARLRAAARAAGFEPVFDADATDRQAARLRRGELGLGVLTATRGTVFDGVDTAVLDDVPLGVLLAAGHPLAVPAPQEHPLAWAELAGQELLWFARGQAAGYHDGVLAVCRAHGWDPRLRIAPARRGVTAAELESGDPVVALRPAGEAGPGLAWRPLAEDAPRLRFLLARRAGTRDVLPDLHR